MEAHGLVIRMEKNRLKTITIIILISFILGGGLFYVYNQVQEEAYQEGVQDAILLINQNILNSLQQNGYVPFSYNTINGTQTINLIPVQNEKS